MIDTNKIIKNILGTQTAKTIKRKVKQENKKLSKYLFISNFYPEEYEEFEGKPESDLKYLINLFKTYGEVKRQKIESFHEEGGENLILLIELKKYVPQDTILDNQFKEKLSKNISNFNREYLQIRFDYPNANKLTNKQLINSLI